MLQHYNYCTVATLEIISKARLYWWELVAQIVMLNRLVRDVRKLSGTVSNQDIVEAPS
jgi:hypothetical protein